MFSAILGRIKGPEIRDVRISLLLCEAEYDSTFKTRTSMFGSYDKCRIFISESGLVLR